MSRASVYIPRILKHEGGFVDHPKDPGGATNRGVTIGTLKRLGIDVNGDGDSDIADLRNLRESDAVRVFAGEVVDSRAAMVGGHYDHLFVRRTARPVGESFHPRRARYSGSAWLLGRRRNRTHAVAAHPAIINVHAKARIGLRVAIATQSGTDIITPPAYPVIGFQKCHQGGSSLTRRCTRSPMLAASLLRALFFIGGSGRSGSVSFVVRQTEI